MEAGENQPVTSLEEHRKKREGQKEFLLWSPMEHKAAGDDGYMYIEGYAAPFDEPDFVGHRIARGAFDETMDQWMKHGGAIQVDHKDGSEFAAGKAINYRIDDKGLWIKARISNSPDPTTTMIRTKIQEGILNGLSIGGMFTFVRGMDGPVIKKVRLKEISLTPVPSFNDARFEVSLAKSIDSISKEEVEMLEAFNSSELEPQETKEEKGVKSADAEEEPQEKTEEPMEEEQEEEEESQEEKASKSIDYAELLDQVYAIRRKIQGGMW